MEEKPKPFAKYSEVVNSLAESYGMDSAIALAKFHYEAKESTEENLERIRQTISKK